MQEDSNSLDREQIFSEFHQLVNQLAKRLVNALDLPRHAHDDLVAGGYLGLVEAAERFDPSQAASFRTFAIYRIRGAMIDTLRRTSDFSGKAYRVARAMDSFYSIREEYRHERDPNQRKDKRKKLEDILNIASTGALAYRLCLTEYDEETPPQLVSHNNGEKVLCDEADNKKVVELLSNLPEKERLIVEEYYFHGLSFVEITKKYPGLSKSWVSRLHKRALEILRNNMFGEWGE